MADGACLLLSVDRSVKSPGMATARPRPWLTPDIPGVEGEPAGRVCANATAATAAARPTLKEPSLAAEPTEKE